MGTFICEVLYVCETEMDVKVEENGKWVSRCVIAGVHILTRPLTYTGRVKRPRHAVKYREMSSQSKAR